MGNPGQYLAMFGFEQRRDLARRIHDRQGVGHSGTELQERVLQHHAGIENAGLDLGERH